MNDNISKLKSTIENYKTNTPILVVDEAFKMFCKAWKYKMINISNDEELEEVITYYSQVKSEIPLVLYDLSNLSKKSLNRLLKFLEEYKEPIILGASRDNFDSILFSRIKTYLRFTKDSVKSDFLPLGEALQTIEDINTDNTIERTRNLLKYSPQLYYYEQSINVRRNKDKILSILGGDI